MMGAYVAVERGFLAVFSVAESTRVRLDSEMESLVLLPRPFLREPLHKQTYIVSFPRGYAQRPDIY